MISVQDFGLHVGARVQEASARFGSSQLKQRLMAVWPGMGSRQFCRGRGRGRGRGREVEAEARQGRGRELEAEARQTKFEARPRRGDPLKNPPSPRCIAVPNLVALSQTV